MIQQDPFPAGSANKYLTPASTSYADGSAAMGADGDGDGVALSTASPVSAALELAGELDRSVGAELEPAEFPSAALQLASANSAAHTVTTRKKCLVMRTVNHQARTRQPFLTELWSGTS